MGRGGRRAMAGLHSKRWRLHNAGASLGFVPLLSRYHHLQHQPSSRRPAMSFETMPTHHGFEDFFNFDMLAASSSSRSSSRSPAHSPAFPPTPPQPSADLFNIGFFDDFAKEADPLALAAAIQAPSVAAPYDFLNAFATYAPASATTTSPSAATSTTAVSPPFAIDPQLVDSPSPIADDDDEDDDEHDDGEDDSPLSLAPKVGGMGKQRKGTVQGGGITKKARAVEKKEELDDNWRPSPEEYKKMSSKEKRQLRNKISARNFRNRRKGQYSSCRLHCTVTHLAHQNTLTPSRGTLRSATASSMPSGPSSARPSQRMSHCGRRSTR
jgi:hypothetical protein